MKGGVMSKADKKRTEELKRLAEQKDHEVDTSDIPEIKDWSDATRGRFYRPVKRQVTLRLDADLLAWFRAQGSKYQTRMNAVLREYMERHRDTR